MVLAEVIKGMNSNYENRKHGGYSQIAVMQSKLFEAYPNVGVENLFTSEFYFPIGQKMEPGSLEMLKATVSEYQSQNTLSDISKTLN